MDLQHILALTLFLAFVLVMLAFDLLVMHRKPHEISLKEALWGTMVPVACATLFIGAIYFLYEYHYFHLGFLPAHVNPGEHAARMFPTSGKDAALSFLIGYLVELSLSADNVFLFVVLMTFFKVPRQYQHRVLFWGVLGALIMRGLMILAAAELARFEWVIYLFGAFLLFTGVKMLFAGAEPKDPGNNLAVRLARKMLPFHDGYDGKNFFTRVNGKRIATTLFLVLICIEFTDLVFALDSIPVIFGITLDPFIVFTSNIFAILGLRSMYFLLAGIIDKFHLLKYGLALVLGFVGVKMVLPGIAELTTYYTGTPHHWEIGKLTSLAVIVFCLAGSIIASLLWPSSTHHANPLARKTSKPHPTV